MVNAVTTSPVRTRGDVSKDNSGIAIFHFNSKYLLLQEEAEKCKKLK